MGLLSKQEVIDAYREMVQAKGTVIGEGIFLRESGITRYTFRGGLWRSWAAFQAEAGYEPNNRGNPDLANGLISEILAWWFHRLKKR
jgi:hypothetical protein